MIKFYAYHIIETKETGITNNWKECEKKVKGVNSKFKSFKTKTEAQEWLSLGANYSTSINKNKSETKTLEKGIYFDSGTGGNNGVQVKLVNEKKENLLPLILQKTQINEFGNFSLGFKVTNNYGELYGLYLALLLAEKIQEKTIFGDSNLVIQYWSVGTYKDTLKKETIELIEKVKLMRKEFEKKGGEIKFISGDINPADLGYHK